MNFIFWECVEPLKDIQLILNGGPMIDQGMVGEKNWAEIPASYAPSKINVGSKSTKEKDSDNHNRCLVGILKNNFKKVVAN